MPEELVRIDLGCGAAKREGCIGLDYVAGPGVDHVLDLATDRYPFEDNSVDEVYSSHFLEHVSCPLHVLAEIGRICKDGARIEIWTPYAFSTAAFLPGHVQFLTEEPWMHYGVHFPEVWAPYLNGRWLFHRVTFGIHPTTVADVAGYGLPMDFAIRYMKGVAWEFGVELEYRSDLDATTVIPSRWWCSSRDGERHELSQPETLGAPLFTPVGSVPPPLQIADLVPVIDNQIQAALAAERRNTLVLRVARHIPQPVRKQIRRRVRA